MFKRKPECVRVISLDTAAQAIEAISEARAGEHGRCRAGGFLNDAENARMILRGVMAQAPNAQHLQPIDDCLGMLADLLTAMDQHEIVQTVEVDRSTSKPE